MPSAARTATAAMVAFRIPDRLRVKVSSVELDAAKVAFRFYRETYYKVTGMGFECGCGFQFLHIEHGTVELDAGMAAGGLSASADLGDQAIYSRFLTRLGKAAGSE